MADNRIGRDTGADVSAIIASVVALALLVFICVSCGVSKPTTVIEYRDSIRVEIRERIVHDSVKVEVPREVEKVVTRDTASRLENDWAKSDAVVSRGFLTHSLETKPRVVYVPVEVSVSDTSTFHGHTEAHTEFVEVEVEKPLSWWQRLKIGAFWWLVALCLVGWRRELLALGKKLIKLLGL